MTREETEKRRRAGRVVAYLFLTGVMALGLWRVETTAFKAKGASEAAAETATAIEGERVRRERALCEIANQNRAAVRQSFDDLIAVVRSQPPRPDLSDDEVARQVERTNRVVEEFLERLEVSLPVIDCETLR